MSVLYQNKSFRSIDTSFVIDTDLFHLDIQKAPDKHFFCKGTEQSITVYCPESTNFETGEFQIWFRTVIRDVLRREAKLIFPKLLKSWSEKTGLNYEKLTIKSTSSKWGSYSSLGNVNLSLYLLLFNKEFVEYTMCHELCHSKEMNHGPNFWRLLDGYLGKDARKVGKQMNKMVQKWYDEGDPRYLLIANK